MAILINSLKIKKQKKMKTILTTITLLVLSIILATAQEHQITITGLYSWKGFKNESENPETLPWKSEVKVGQEYIFYIKTQMNPKKVTLKVQHIPTGVYEIIQITKSKQIGSTTYLTGYWKPEKPGLYNIENYAGSILRKTKIPVVE